ncbi:hypothetical protein [Arthrobacter monumenti]
MGNDAGTTPSRPSSPVPVPPDDWFVLLNRIDVEVRQLQQNRARWEELTSTDQPAGKPAEWVGGLYIRTQMLGIRRMIDGDRRAGSFKRLLHKMTEATPRLARSWFLENVPAKRAVEADAVFTRLADPWKSGHLDSTVTREDLRALETACTGIKRYVDQHVTHAQLDSDAGLPTAVEVDAALNMLSELLEKYSLLLNRPA